MTKSYGFVPADILIPADTDMSKWSCVACDQYTSEPEYWKSVEDYVGDSPSTLNMMLPEIYLNETELRSKQITDTMHRYVDSGLFTTVSDSFIYVERTLANGKVRRGLVGCIDLEVYDFSKDTTSLCRPTEATVTSRLPARVEVRKKALLEMPHIMMLLDDSGQTVIEQFTDMTDRLDMLYDFDMMQNSGHIRGYRVNGENTEKVMYSIAKLYRNNRSEHPMLYAMGDGNHSLAAAKQYYEQLKADDPKSAQTHPARYALVELVNLHDHSLEFEPINRVFFGTDTDRFLDEFKKYCGLKKGRLDGQVFRLVINKKSEYYTFTEPKCSLTIGTIQDFLDSYSEAYGGETDYIHGDDVVINLCNSDDRIGFIVDAISKNSFFDVIKKDGVLPRKTFSMGNACDKRFYLECRKLTE